MSTTQVIYIGRELVWTAILVATPTVLISLVVGLVISIFQAVTSIQEQTLTFAPRMFAVGVAFILSMPWTLRVLVNFTHRMIWQLAEAGH